MQLPRGGPGGLVGAAPRSGAGKTTIALGLMRALRRRGLAVQPFKCGPDYIDPAFHAVAAGRPSYNLDTWAMAEGTLSDLVARHAATAEVVIAEGVMGLFDGVAQPGQTARGATADLAALFGWPVVLVLDVSGQTETAAAVAMGCARYRCDVGVAGVILNRVSSARHLALIAPAFERIGLTLFGAIANDADLTLPERHLGLVQAGETADIERVKKALAELNLLPEDWGGKTICVPISAKQKIGIPELLDTVLLLADLTEFKADPARPAVGTIIEARLDKGEGPVATALVAAGTLRPGDFLIAGSVAGKVRGMRDFRGATVREATPSTPVRVLGLKQVPAAGDVFHVVTEEREARDVMRSQTKFRRSTTLNDALAAAAPVEGEDASVSAVATLNVVLKTDVLGSREAVVASLRELATPDVGVKVIRTALGSINESDVTQAEATKAVVFGFNVPIVPQAADLARTRRVFVQTYKVIYDLLDEAKKQMSTMLKP